MKSKLRKIGNSLGVTLPSGELKALGASTGDMLELEIVRVIPAARQRWDNAEAWRGGDASEVMLDVDNEFDEAEWEW